MQSFEKISLALLVMLMFCFGIAMIAIKPKQYYLPEPYFGEMQKRVDGCINTLLTNPNPNPYYEPDDVAQAIEQCRITYAQMYQDYREIKK